MSKESNFTDLMLLAAAVMDQDDLIAKLKSDIVKYENAPSKEEKDRAFEMLQIGCSLVMTKRIAPDLKTATKVRKEIKNREEIISFYKGDGEKN